MSATRTLTQGFSAIARLFAAAAAIALAAACSDDPAGPRMPAAGSYRLNLAGDYTARHTGEAIFGVDGNEGHEYFAVLLGVEQADMANLVMVRSGTTRFELGTHQVANTTDQFPDDEDAIEILLGVGNDTSSIVGFFDGQSGTVTITRSSDDVLAGTFSVVAKGLLEENGGTAEPATLKISGAFTAEPVPGTSNARMRVEGVRLQRLAH